MSNSPFILVPVGTAQDMRAVEFAAHLAAIIGAQVRALHVAHDLTSSAVEAADIAVALDRIETAPVDFVRIASDSTAHAIAEAAAEARLVCMTTAATVLPHEGHVGSIAAAVVRLVGKPVVLVGPKATGTVQQPRIVVPVDGSEYAESALAPAADLAAMLGAEVWIVTVLSRRQTEQAESMVGAEIGVLESAYVRRLARHIGRDAQFEVLHGSDPAAAILDFAHPDGIVVMSTHGRTAVARLFAGSVATEIVAASELPVVVLRPPDDALVAD